MMTDFLAVIRHVLTAVGGGLVTAGYLTNDQLTAIVGGIVAAVGLGFSLWQKRRQKAEVAKALATPPPAA